MKMSASDAFSALASGTMNDHAAKIYNEKMLSYYSKYEGATGWLAEVVQKASSRHNEYMRTRMYEFGKRIKSDIGKFVGEYDIGYLGGYQYQQKASGLMEDIIMANPILMELYNNEMISGYNGNLHPLNKGIREDNYFYQKITDGLVVNIETEDGNQSSYKTYSSSRDKNTKYSVSERADALRTWRASEAYVKNGIDPTSRKGDFIASLRDDKKDD